MMGIRFVLACKMFFLCNNNKKDHKSVRFCYFWVKLLSRLESLIVIHYFIMWARQAVKGTLGHLNNLTQQEFAVGLLPTINFRIWKNLLLITYHAKRNIVKLVLCIQPIWRGHWAWVNPCKRGPSLPTPYLIFGRWYWRELYNSLLPCWCYAPLLHTQGELTVIYINFISVRNPSLKVQGALIGQFSQAWGGSTYLSFLFGAWLRKNYCIVVTSQPPITYVKAPAF